MLGERLSLLSTGEDQQQHETGEVRARRFPSWPARAGPAQKAARPRGELRTLSAQGSSARSERGRIQRLLANGGRLRILVSNGCMAGWLPVARYRRAQCKHASGSSGAVSALEFDDNAPGARGGSAACVVGGCSSSWDGRCACAYE